MDAVYVAFPDYPVTIPFYVRPFIKSEGTVTRDAGHAGALLIDPETGKSTYFEYGRYDKEQRGLTRRAAGPQIAFDKDGKATKESLNGALKELSDKAGKQGRVEGVLVEGAKESYEKQKAFADEKFKQNADPKRRPYDWKDWNCGDFARETVNAGLPDDGKLPDSDFRPKYEVPELQKRGTSVSYDPANMASTQQGEGRGESRATPQQSTQGSAQHAVPPPKSEERRSEDRE